MEEPDWLVTPKELDAWKPAERKPPTPRQRRQFDEMDAEAAAGMGMGVEEYRNRFKGVEMADSEVATRQKEPEGEKVQEMKRQAGLGVTEPAKSQGPDADDPTMVGAVLGGLKLAREAIKAAANTPGAAPIWAAARGGLKDLQEVALRPLPDSMSTTSEPGGIAIPLQLEVYQQKHPEGVNVHGNKPGKVVEQTPKKKKKGPSM